MKTCSRCGVPQDEIHFTPRAASADGLSSACKICLARDKKDARAKLKTRPEEEIEAAAAARGPRVCRKCKVSKGPDEFPRDRGRKDGRGTMCLPCAAVVTRYYQSIADPEEVKRRKRADFQNNRETLRTNFGITLERYQEMHDEQGGLCAICARPETAKRKDRLLCLAVDHDHVTGAVRRLLCNNCNHGLGHFKDSPDLLLRAVQYLRDHVTSSVEAQPPA